MGVDMTKDTLMTKVANMQNLLSYLADDEEEVLAIMIHMCAQRAGVDSSKLVKPLEDIRDMKRKAAGGNAEWL